MTDNQKKRALVTGRKWKLPWHYLFRGQGTIKAKAPVDHHTHHYPKPPVVAGPELRKK